MKRAEFYDFISNIDDPEKDYGKILSNVHFTHYHLMEKYKRLLEKYDLTPAQSNALGVVNYFFPKAVALEDIREMILEPNSDVSRTVNRLVKKELLEKVSNPENRRKVSIQVTRKGKKVIDALRKDKSFGTLTKSFTLTEARHLISLLEKFHSQTHTR